MNLVIAGFNSGMWPDVRNTHSQRVGCILHITTFYNEIATSVSNLASRL